MTSRERVMNALNFMEVDRLPTSLGGSAHKLHDKNFFELLKYYNLDKAESHKELTGGSYSYYHTGLWKCLGIDIMYVHLNPPVDKNEWPSTNAFREWGIQAENKYGLINFTEYTLNNIKNSEELQERISLPKPTEEERTEGLYKSTKYLFDSTDFAIAGYRPVPAGIFELSQAYLGMEKLLLSFYDNPELIKSLFDAILHAQMLFYERQLDAVGKYIQIVEIIDDLGSQNGPLISPNMYRTFLKPVHKKLVQFIKQKAPRANVLIHSCGSVEAFIDDFIDIGIHILNPIQVRAKDMDPNKLREKYGDRICFEGGIDVQYTMRGSTEDVKREVRALKNKIGNKGGYILAPSHNIEDEVPMKNVISLFEDTSD